MMNYNQYIKQNKYERGGAQHDHIELFMDHF